MDVGCWLLRTTSANLLKNCIHPVWGLIYSNGTSLYLMPISSINDHTYLHPKLMKVDNVGLIHDLSCSPAYQNVHYVAIINSHDAGLKLSVWDAKEEDLNKIFAKPSEILIHGNPLPQGLGLAWHPKENVICVVCQNEGYVFKNGTKNKTLEKIRSFSGTERFNTCCWNYSGSMLIFATQSKLLFYNFTVDPCDANDPVFSFVIGKVCSLETLDQNRLLCTVELPLRDVMRHRSDQAARDALSTTATQQEHQTTAKSSSLLPDSIVASSQLLLIGYNASDNKPYIMARTDIQEILTPNIMVYEDANALCIIASCSSTKLQFFTIDKLNISKTAEMVLEKGKVPKGVAISAFNNTKLLWLLSGQCCPECTASLAVPDKEYVSCNMTFRVIALNCLLGPEQRFLVQEKDFAGCVDRCKTLPKSNVTSSSPQIKFTEGTSSIKYTAGETSVKKSADVKKIEHVQINTAHHDLDAGKSALTHQAAQPTATTAKKVADVGASSSNEEYYSVGPASSGSKPTTPYCSLKKKGNDIEKYVTDLTRRHSVELNDIKSELQEIKRILTSLSHKPITRLHKVTTPSSAQILCHIEDLQHNMHMVENKVDSLSMDITTKLKHQDRKLSDIRKEIGSLISNHHH